MVSLPELTLLFIIGLLVLGPERLPRVASQIGRWVGKARRTANQLRYQLEREIALADLERAATEKAKTTSNAPDESQTSVDSGDTAATSTADSESTDSADDADNTGNTDNEKQS